MRSIIEMRAVGCKRTSIGRVAGIHHRFLGHVSVIESAELSAKRTLGLKKCYTILFVFTNFFSAKHVSVTRLANEIQEDSLLRVRMAVKKVSVGSSERNLPAVSSVKCFLAAEVSGSSEISRDVEHD